VRAEALEMTGQVEHFDNLWYFNHIYTSNHTSLLQQESVQADTRLDDCDSIPTDTGCPLHFTNQIQALSRTAFTTYKNIQVNQELHYNSIIPCLRSFTMMMMMMMWCALGLLVGGAIQVP